MIYGLYIAGNRKTETIVNGTNTTVNNYTYNDQDLLTEVSSKVNNTLKDTMKYTYDNNGNQLTALKTAATGSTGIVLENKYDAFNQLIESNTATGTVKNSYNGEGYRTVKTVGTNSTYYYYEGDKVLLETDATGSVKAKNTYGLNLLTRNVEGKTYNYMYNGHET